MNFKKILAFGLMTCSIAFIGCEKEKDDHNNGSNSANRISIGENNFDISGVALEFFGEHSFHQGHNVVLTILGGNWSMVNNQEQLDFETNGSGAIFYADIFTTDSLILSSGTYNYNDSSMTVMTFDYGLCGYNSGTKPFENDIITGTIEVDYGNNNYTITVATVDDQGNHVSASYSGGVIIYDYTE